MAGPSQVPLTEADHYQATVFVSVTVVLAVIAVATLVNRIISKLRSGSSYLWEDYLILAGTVS